MMRLKNANKIMAAHQTDKVHFFVFHSLEVFFPSFSLYKLRQDYVELCLYKERGTKITSVLCMASRFGSHIDQINILQNCHAR